METISNFYYGSFYYKLFIKILTMAINTSCFPLNNPKRMSMLKAERTKMHRVAQWTRKIYT